jgi:hypothetical protein
MRSTGRWTRPEEEEELLKDTGEGPRSRGSESERREFPAHSKVQRQGTEHE